MQTEIVIAGFGGQGILFAGQILARAAMALGRNVTWLPSYGPEMRGGTANVTVIISDEEIGSPLTPQPQAVLVFNLPSLQKYEPLVKPGGVLVVNSSLIDQPVQRTDITVAPVPANDIALELGSDKAANMVMLGALVAATNVLPLDRVAEALREYLVAHGETALSADEAALHRGATSYVSAEVG